MASTTSGKGARSSCNSSARSSRCTSCACTDRLGGEANERPVHFGEIFATLYDRVGINANQVTLPDLSGRPQFLVDGWEPLKEVI